MTKASQTWKLLKPFNSETRDPDKRSHINRIFPPLSFSLSLSHTHTHTHTHTQTVLRPSWILSRITWVSQHQKGKTRKVKPIWIYWSKRQWMAVASAGPYANLHLDQTHNHASIPPLSFLQAGCPSRNPTNRVKALKAHLTHTPHSPSQMAARLVQLFCPANAAFSIYITLCHPISRKNWPFQWGDLDPHLIHCSLDPPNPPPQMASRSSLPFFQNTQSLPTDRQTEGQNKHKTLLYAIEYPVATMGHPKLTPTLPLPLRRSSPHLIHTSLGRPHSPPKTASRSNQPCCHSTLSGPTDRHRG